MNSDREANLQAAVAAIGQGQLTQISTLADEIRILDEGIEKVTAHAGGAAFGGPVDDVDVIENDAKTAEIRDGLQALQESFNTLLANLRRASLIGE